MSLSALAGALQQNRHLRTFSLNFVVASAPIASAYKKHLLPTVLACTSLRKLDITQGCEGHDERPVAAEAAAVMQLVADREAARLAAVLAKEPGRSA